MNTVMSYLEGESFFHKLHPLTKLAWAIMTCFCCFLCNNIYLLATIVLMNIAIAIYAKIFRQAKGTLKMFAILGSCLFIIQALCMQEGEVIFHPIKWLSLTDKGISSGLLLALRMSGALLPLTLMIMLTPIKALTTEMEEKLHIPYKYTFVLTTTLKFIPSFSKEMEQIIQAQVCRGCDLDTKNILKRIKMIIPLSVPLLISSVRKIEQQAICLKLRGFNAPKRTRYKKSKTSYRDFIISGYMVLLVAISIIF